MGISISASSLAVVAARITSNVATLTIGGLASITTQPVNDTVCQGANASFFVTAANASTYSWEMDNGSGFQTITASATYQNPATPQLTVVNVTAAMRRQSVSLQGR
jgi:predicted RNA-binding protein with PUA-like domain